MVNNRIGIPIELLINGANLEIVLANIKHKYNLDLSLEARNLLTGQFTQAEYVPSGWELHAVIHTDSEKFYEMANDPALVTEIYMFLAKLLVSCNSTA